MDEMTQHDQQVARAGACVVAAGSDRRGEFLATAIAAHGIDVTARVSLDATEVAGALDRLWPVIVVDFTDAADAGFVLCRELMRARRERQTLAFGADRHQIRLLSIGLGVEVLDRGTPHGMVAARIRHHADAVRRVASQRGAAHSLTPKEVEVLTHLAVGCSATEIAQRMYVHKKTVANHLHNTYAKLGVNRNTEAVWLAQTLGIVPLPLVTNVD
jgi:DNA-binding NarL/FixJ family response regulator